MRIAAIVVAAGKGTRAGSGAVPKQYCDVAGKSVLTRSIAAFESHPEIRIVQIVVNPADHLLYEAATAGFSGRLLPPVAGGYDRQASVLCGLEALAAHTPDAVIIHDGARPFVDAATISRVVAGLDRWPGCIAALPLADTLKLGGLENVIGMSIDRTNLWRAQTPQAFRFGPILKAHRQAAGSEGKRFTDDAAVAEWAGMAVGLVAGSERNQKLTTPEDFDLANVSAASPDIRTGSGFDVHRFTAGDHVMLCGVRIPHSLGVEAHSDGDVALHALTDAVLGAIGAGDIGEHFPSSDLKWKDAASAQFLAEAGRLVRARGGRISNVDVTILCERPHVSAFRAAMRARTADILELGVDRVSVKATTTEKLGFTGRGEGLAAMASATVILPGDG